MCTLINSCSAWTCDACETPRGGGAGKRQQRIDDPAAGSQERRGARFIRSPSIAIQDRIDRALEQRLYLLKAQRHHDGSGAAFAVLGSTGNVYSVDFDLRPSCDCPDFLKGRGLCKHILFIWLRVLRCSSDDFRIWQQALVPSELESALEPLFRQRARRLPFARKAVLKAFAKATAEDHPIQQEDTQPGEPGGRTRHSLDGDDCPVCFECMTQAEEDAGLLTFCCSCGNNFHADCMRRWQRASSGTCPLCREAWSAPPKAVKPGECLPAPATKQCAPASSSSLAAGGYLNLRAG